MIVLKLEISLCIFPFHLSVINFSVKTFSTSLPSLIHKPNHNHNHNSATDNRYSSRLNLNLYLCANLENLRDNLRSILDPFLRL